MCKTFWGKSRIWWSFSQWTVISPHQGRELLDIVVYLPPLNEFDGWLLLERPWKNANIKCCCFFKTLGSPLGSEACSVLTAVAIQYSLASITQAFVSVRRHPADQRLNHCVSTRPANKDDLSALSSIPLLSFFLQQHSQQFQIHWQRIWCTALP